MRNSDDDIRLLLVAAADWTGASSLSNEQSVIGARAATGFTAGGARAARDIPGGNTAMHRPRTTGGFAIRMTAAAECITRAKPVVEAVTALSFALTTAFTEPTTVIETAPRLIVVEAAPER